MFICVVLLSFGTSLLSVWKWNCKLFFFCLEEVGFQFESFFFFHLNVLKCGRSSLSVWISFSFHWKIVTLLFGSLFPQMGSSQFQRSFTTNLVVDLPPSLFLEPVHSRSQRPFFFPAGPLSFPLLKVSLWLSFCLFLRYFSIQSVQFIVANFFGQLWHFQSSSSLSIWKEHF